MKKYRKVLIATDLSETSAEAAKEAIGLARHYGARVVLMHVVEHFPAHLPHYRMSDGDLDPREYVVKQAEKDLELLCDKLGVGEAEREVVVTTHSAKAEIVDYAKNNDVDLIVVGAHGNRSAFDLLGSTTSTGIVRAAPCDVFVVQKAEK